MQEVKLLVTMLRRRSAGARGLGSLLAPASRLKASWLAALLVPCGACGNLQAGLSGHADAGPTSLHFAPCRHLAGTKLAKVLPHVSPLHNINQTTFSEALPAGGGGGRHQGGKRQHALAQKRRIRQIVLPLTLLLVWAAVLLGICA